MNNKPRSDSIIAQLPEEAQSRIHEWIASLGYTEALRKIALPPPDGFGLETHRTSLRRFYARRSRAIRDTDLAELKAAPESSPIAAGTFESAAGELVSHAAYDLSSGPVSPADFDRLSRWHTKQQYLRVSRDQLALARERLQFERDKYEFDIARQVLIHFRSLERISDDRKAEDLAKINAARALIFGVPVDQLPPMEQPHSANSPGQGTSPRQIVEPNSAE